MLLYGVLNNYDIFLMIYADREITASVSPHNSGEYVLLIYLSGKSLLNLRTCTISTTDHVFFFKLLNSSQDHFSPTD